MSVCVPHEPTVVGERAGVPAPSSESEQVAVESAPEMVMEAVTVNWVASTALQPVMDEGMDERPVQMGWMAEQVVVAVRWRRTCIIVVGKGC